MLQPQGNWLNVEGQDNESAFLNLDHVRTVRDFNGGAVLTFSDGSQFAIKETPDVLFMRAQGREP